MSTVSRSIKKVVRSRPSRAVGSALRSRWTWAALLMGAVASVGVPTIMDHVPRPTPAPSEQYVPIPSPAPVSPQVQAPTQVPPVGSEKPGNPDGSVPEHDGKTPSEVSTPKATSENPTGEGPCFEKRHVQQWQTYTYQQKYVGEETGTVIYKPTVGKKLVTTEVPVRVPCKDAPAEKSPTPAPAPEVKPVNPPAPPAPSVVVPGTVMYGVKGLGGIGDPAAFRDFATARGFTPVWIDTWDPSEAQAKIEAGIKKSTLPYALYGFSLGAKVVRDFAQAHSDNPPMLVVTVGASSVVAMEGKFDPKTKVEHYFHENTKHDAPGVYLKAPHTGNGNIQRIIADEAIAKSKK